MMYVDDPFFYDSVVLHLHVKIDISPIGMTVVKLLSEILHIAVVNESLIKERYACLYKNPRLLQNCNLLTNLLIKHIADSSRMRYKYYPEGSKVLLKCLLDMQWFGPAHFNNSFNQPSVIDLNENRSMWTINRYTEGKSVSPTLPHHNRFKVVRRIQTGNYELQISNASDFDEGLYFCQDSEMPTAYDYYFLKLISK